MKTGAHSIDRPPDPLRARQALEDAQAIEGDIVSRRRELHRHPEPGFGEFQTSAAVQLELAALGFNVKAAEEAMDASAVFSQHEERIAASAARALASGLSQAAVERMREHGTAVVADLVCGQGPIVALRFDMDCLPVNEVASEDHLPAREGFRSTVAGEMHACGHDGHVAIGLGVGRLLASRRSELAGTVRLIFQPAEEGAMGGAHAITARGLLDDVDHLISMHLGLGAASGEFVARAFFLATSKYRVRFTGRGAHVVNSPEDGRNALLAAASAALNLHAIAPHGKSWFSVNVGVLHAGDEQGVTPPWATMDLGLWAETAEVHDYVVDRLHAILGGAATSWGVEVAVEQIGGAPTAAEDPKLGALACRIADQLPIFERVKDTLVCRAGEDATVFLNRVAEHNGRGIYVLIGSDLAAGHHAPNFDFDERSLTTGAGLLTALASHLLTPAATAQN